MPSAAISQSERTPRAARSDRTRVFKVLLSNRCLGVLGLIAGALGLWVAFDSPLDRAWTAAAAAHWDAAARFAKQALRRRPDEPEARLLYARAALERSPRQFETALQWARSVPHNERWAETAWDIEGLALWGLARAARAEAVWKHWMDAKPGAALPCWHLSRLYEMQQRRTEARVMGLEYTRRARAKTGGLVELMRQATERPEPFYVIGLWKACVEHDPDDAESRRALGVCHVLNDERAAGMPLLEWYVRRRPESLEGYDALIGAHLEQGDFAAARGLLAHLPAAADGDARFWEYRARVAADQAQWKRVEECYRRALALNPFDPKTNYRRTMYYELGQALQRLGREAEAAEWLEEARKLNVVWAGVPQVYDPLTKTSEPSPEQCHQAALFCYLVGFLPEARAWYREVLLRQPWNADSRTALEALASLELRFQAPHAAESMLPAHTAADLPPLPALPLVESASWK